MSKNNGMQLVYSGSVKDLYKKDQHLVFEYSDRYSIFDWGEMPNQIPQKGEALASMAASFFEYLEARGIPSHYISSFGPKAIEVKSVNVLRPLWIEGQYDYTMYNDRPTDTLVPLEVIFRKHLGQGNSLESRLQKNPSYLDDLGLTQIPNASSTFDPALVEMSTKLEASDRYVTNKEISEMNIVSDEELKTIREQTQSIVKELDSLFSSFGVKLWDGKVEYAFGKVTSSGARSIELVDSIGPDELRLTYEDQPLSKEFLRQIYARSSWYAAVKKSKDLASERKVQDWKKICVNELREAPKPLTKEQVEVSTLLYQALANEVARAVGRALPFASELNLKLWHAKAQSILGSSL